MDSEWSTLNARRTTQTGRDLDLLRRRYAEQRAHLEQLAVDAPSEHLAVEYRRLQALIDDSIANLAELDRGKPRRTVPGNAPVRPPERDPEETALSADLRHEPAYTTPEESSDSGDGKRILIILGVGAAVLAFLAWMAWRFVGKREEAAARPASAITETESTTADEAPVIEEPAQPAAQARLSAAPSRWDFGNVRKGTRATHSFELTNNADTQVTIRTSRSTCRCLWFEHPPTLAPGGAGTLVVTIDGGRAKAGKVDEIVHVTAGNASTDIGITANVQAPAP